MVFEWFASEEGRRNVSRETFETPESDRSFSLRSLRRERLGKVERSAKVDADDIAADPLRSLVFPTAEEIDEAFSADGLVGSLYEDFEPREEQRAMPRPCALRSQAPRTLWWKPARGVGKSMAYLVPSALTARKNGITVGVATKTNALLDQLVYHELPALSRSLAEADPDAPSLTYAPLKGFAHYPCLRKIDRLVGDGDHVRVVAGKEQSQSPALAALLSFIEQTEYDDMDSLKIDYRVLPRRMVTTTSHDCLRRKCPYFGVSCFVHGARRRAEAADVVVTNHSLLFCDLVLRTVVCCRLSAIGRWTRPTARRPRLAARSPLHFRPRISPGSPAG